MEGGGEGAYEGREGLRGIEVLPHPSALSTIREVDEAKTVREIPTQDS